MPSLWNQNWRTVKSETEKVNDLLTNIPTNITELNYLIYAVAKLVSQKFVVSLKTTNRKSKYGWEIRLKSQIRKLRQQAKILKRNMKIYSNETEKVLQKLKVQLEETNQKILAKEG